jgi:hypothetical protein
MATTVYSTMGTREKKSVIAFVMGDLSGIGISHSGIA